ncbi:hypothetical protein UF12_09625 [Acinetobacter calcoaceticus]|nr:hypothetical protein UF12_09625 [Acinetobacter calcoaceticus]
MDHDLKSFTNYVYQWIQQISSKSAYLNLSKYVQVNFVLRRFMKNTPYAMHHKGFYLFLIIHLVKLRKTKTNFVGRGLPFDLPKSHI